MQRLPNVVLRGWWFLFTAKLCSLNQLRGQIKYGLYSQVVVINTDLILFLSWLARQTGLYSIWPHVTLPSSVYPFNTKHQAWRLTVTILLLTDCSPFTLLYHCLRTPAGIRTFDPRSKGCCIKLYPRETTCILWNFVTCIHEWMKLQLVTNIRKIDNI